MKKRLILHYPNLILISITILCGVILYYLFQNDSFEQSFFLTVALLGLSWLMTLIDRLFKISFPRLLYYIYYVFLLLSIFLGSIFNFNSLFSWYPLFIHFLLGFGFSFFGVFLIVRLDNIGFLKFSVLMTYTFFFVGMATQIYGIFEFIGESVFFGESDAKEIVKNSVMVIFGGISFSILLLIDNHMYNNKYLEKLIKVLS